MIKRTHLAIGLAAALYFLPHVRYKLLFVPIVLISSLLPDIDSSCSTAGKGKVWRPLQIFMKHRGLIHSYTLCILISVIFSLFLPVVALPFFLGYSFHILADSFTVKGIRPFWPLRFRTSGVVRTGGTVDNSIFVTFLIIDFFLILLFFIF